MVSPPHHRLTHASRTLLLSMALLVMLTCNKYDPLDMGLQESAAQWATRQAIEGTHRASSSTVEASIYTSIAQTQDAMAALEAELHAAQTEEAAPISREDAVKTAQAEAAAPAPQIEAPPVAAPPAADAPAPLAPAPLAGSSPPVITKVDFLKAIPATGTEFSGWVSFTDPDGDVNLMTLDVVSAKTMKGSQGDPNKSLQGTPTEGRYRIRFWCFVKQEITMRVTLFDAAGNSSNSVDFSFECY